MRTRVMGTVVVGEKTQLWLWENKCGPGVEKEDWGGHRLLGGCRLDYAGSRPCGWPPEGTPFGT